MKKLICLVFVALIVALSVITAFGHGGRTDSKGGHNDYSDNSYHYHHGYGPHLHDDGYCPIEPENERYYTDFYKFKLFLSEIPKEYIYTFTIVVNTLLATVFIFLIMKRRAELFPELSFEERDKIQTIQIQYFGNFNTTDFLGNILCIIISLILFTISLIVIDQNNHIGIIFICLLFTAFYVHKIYKEYKTSHNTTQTVHYSKKTIAHIFDDITNDDHIDVNPSDCYLPQHFQIKFMVFVFYIISLILFLVSFVISVLVQKVML